MGKGQNRNGGILSKKQRGGGEKEDALIDASSKGDIKIVEELLKDININVDEKEERFGVTALIAASSRGHTKIVEMLLVKKANMEVTDDDGRTALSWAIEKGQIEIVRMLLRNGANMEVIDKNFGDTALIWASEEGQIEIVRMLLDAGAIVDAVNKRGDTALTRAKARGRQKIVTILNTRINKPIELSEINLSFPGGKRRTRRAKKSKKSKKSKRNTRKTHRK